MDVKIRYRNLTVADPAHKRALLQAVERVLDHGRIILGEEVARFEDAVARYCTRAHCVGVNSGTDALYLALRALEIGPGDEVVTTPMSWVATANAIALTGARPVFADVGADLNLDPDCAAQAMTSRTRAIVPVHFTGAMCDMPRFQALAEAKGVHLVEDAAQAFGSRFDGRPAGGFGVLACFSMNPMKVLNAYGEAGAVVTDDPELHAALLRLRYAGTVDKEDCHTPSLNGRIDTVQAAMLLVELERLDAKIARLREIAARYDAALADVVTCPAAHPQCMHTYYSYTIRTPRRDALRDHLAAQGVETKIQHPILLPEHTAYRGRVRARIPRAQQYVREILCIPNHEKLTDKDVDYVADCIRAFFEGR